MTMTFLLIASACMMDDDDEETAATTTSSASTGGGAPLETAHASGTVSASATIAEGNDGIGTLYVGAFDRCSHTEGTLLGAAIVPDADLSQAVPFSIAELPRTTVYLAGFLDDNENADTMAPLPDAGDLIYGDPGDGILSCVEVDLSDGDVAGVSIDFNGVED
jgi:hypothetical protein